MPYLGIFGLELWETIVIFEISTLKLVKNESLTQTVNFGIGPAFSKGLESAFSEGPGPGLGLLIKYARYISGQNYADGQTGTKNTPFASQNLRCQIRTGWTKPVFFICPIGSERINMECPLNNNI